MPFDIHLDVFDTEECDRILKIGLTSLKDQADSSAGIEGFEESPTRVRESSVAWIARDDSTDWIYERLESIAESANEEYFFDLDGFSEELQFTAYETPGAHYIWHHDGLDPGLEHRKLSLVLQLTSPDEYEGADLEFLEVAEDYDQDMRAEYLADCRAQGTVATFPAFEYHRVTPLESGKRYSIVCWLAGPPFR